MTSENKNVRSRNELDSFYDSKIIVYLQNRNMADEAQQILRGQGFSYITVFDDPDEFFRESCTNKHDLIIIDLKIKTAALSGYDAVSMIRENDIDVALITVSSRVDDMKKKLEFSIHRHFKYPFLTENLVRASKKALGDKASYEIGMQFFDALFGMQMCTHRDLHQRTFDHVIRTTKIYAKFLLHLNHRGYLELTSWSLKNCLMASLVHDIGKLLVMHGVLYKDGKLSAFEFEQVKRHPWNSITALLGGHDIDFFAKENGPLQTVSGYNDKNLSAQVQRWIFKLIDGDTSALADADHYFDELSHKPFIHALNIDLLYIVFRHHDGLEKSYSSDEELAEFGMIMGRDIKRGLSADSSLDVVTNALSICDMYDALLDTKRDYRKTSYSKFFTLFTLYGEMQRKKFFPFLAEEFIRFVTMYELSEGENPLVENADPDIGVRAIQTMSELFIISKDQEADFNEFLTTHRDAFIQHAPQGKNEGLLALHEQWIEFHDARRKELMNFFLNELKNAGLLNKEISDFSLKEIKAFDMLYQFYYSYSSSIKQKRLIDYLVQSVTKPVMSDEAKKRLIAVMSSEKNFSRRDLDRILVEEVYDRNDLFEVFSGYDEDTLINELNDYLRRTGI